MTKKADDLAHDDIKTYSLVVGVTSLEAKMGSLKQLVMVDLNLSSADD